MLDRLLRNALDGLTVIEETNGSVSSMLARQLGGYAKAVNRKVLTISLAKDTESMLREVGPRGASLTQDLGGDYGGGMGSLRLEGLDCDMLILDAFSSFAFGKSEREISDTVRQLLRYAKPGKCVVLTYDPGALGERATAYIRGAADTVIEVRTEFSLERVTRQLYIPKMKGSRPADRLFKVTVDDRGVEIDTREFIG